MIIFGCVQHNQKRMKSIKYLLFLIILAFIGLSIYVAVQPNSFEVSKTTSIKAPASIIFDMVNDSTQQNTWTSFNPEDQTKTLNATAPNTITQQLKSTNLPTSGINWSFQPDGKGATNVTQTLKADNLSFGFKMASVFKGDVAHQLGSKMEQNLGKLDSAVIKSMEVYSIKINGLTDYGGGFFMYKSIATTVNNLSNVMAKQYAEIMNFMSEHSIPFTGMPFTIYLKMDSETNNVVISNAIPVKDKINVADDSPVLCGYMDRTKALKVTLKGNYTNLGEAWEKAFQYIKDNHLEPSEMSPFEVYTNDPGSTPNPANWITEIYIPVKENKVQ